MSILALIPWTWWRSRPLQNEVPVPLRQLELSELEEFNKAIDNSFDDSLDSLGSFKQSIEQPLRRGIKLPEDCVVLKPTVFDAIQRGEQIGRSLVAVWTLENGRINVGWSKTNWPDAEVDGALQLLARELQQASAAAVYTAVATPAEVAAIPTEEPQSAI